MTAIVIIIAAPAMAAYAAIVWVWGFDVGVVEGDAVEDGKTVVVGGGVEGSIEEESEGDPEGNGEEEGPVEAEGEGDVGGVGVVEGGGGGGGSVDMGAPVPLSENPWLS